MNSDNTNKFPKNKKISADQIWALIEETLAPWDSLPDKATMTEEQILKLHHIIVEANEIFRMLAQIAELKKSIDELTKK